MGRWDGWEGHVGQEGMSGRYYLKSGRFCLFVVRALNPSDEGREV